MTAKHRLFLSILTALLIFTGCSASSAVSAPEESAQSASLGAAISKTAVSEAAISEAPSPGKTAARQMAAEPAAPASSDTTGTADTGTDAEVSRSDSPLMVRINDSLYQFTGQLHDDALRCGNMDGQITSEVDSAETPVQNNQSNFGTGYGYQYGAPDSIEVYMPYNAPDEMHWLIFSKKDASFASSEPLTSAPVLALSDPLASAPDSFELQSGSYNWNYPSGDQICSLIACGPHPLDGAPDPDSITLKLPRYNDQRTVTYAFSCQVPADALTIRQWNKTDIGNTDADVISVTSIDDPEPYVELESGYLYELTLEWKEENLDTNGFYGDASYVLITE